MYRRIGLSDAERADAFRAWYTYQGHWIYQSRAEAVSTWRERGINGLSSHTPKAEQLLADWLAKEAA